MIVAALVLWMVGVSALAIFCFYRRGWPIRDIFVRPNTQQLSEMLRNLSTIEWTALILITAITLWIGFAAEGARGPLRGCPNEFRLCSDGTYVPRIGRSCDFAPCGGAIAEEDSDPFFDLPATPPPRLGAAAADNAKSPEPRFDLERCDAGARASGLIVEGKVLLTVIGTRGHDCLFKAMVEAPSRVQVYECSLARNGLPGLGYKKYIEAAEFDLIRDKSCRASGLQTLEMITARAQHGDAKAEYDLGDYYGRSNSLTADFSEAVKWYRKAADQGNVMAEYRLGTAFERGLGLQQSYPEAAKWYQKAAEKNLSVAQTSLGRLFDYGLGVNPDPHMAALWYYKAAVKGDREAQAALAELYLQGRGVDRNPAQAAFWLIIAAKSGNKDYASRRDQILQSLSPDKIPLLQQRADAWRPEPAEPAGKSVR